MKIVIEDRVIIVDNYSNRTFTIWIRYIVKTRGLRWQWLKQIKITCGRSQIVVEEKYQLADWSRGIAPGFCGQSGLEISLGLPGSYSANHYSQCIYDGPRIIGRVGRAAGIV